MAPISEIHPRDWDLPDPAGFDAVMLTSANAARHAGPGLAALRHLPCYAVGASTARAASGVGFADIRAGDYDGAALMAIMADDDVRRALHLCGEETADLPALVPLAKRVVYESRAATSLPELARSAMADAPIALLHSPRAAALFGKLVDDAELSRGPVTLIAISPNAAAAAGPGWRAVHVADRPSDSAMLEIAAKLCETPGVGGDRSE